MNVDELLDSWIRDAGKLSSEHTRLEVLAAMAEQVISEATQIWHGAAGLDVILVTGGGALLLGPAIKAHFRHAQVVDDPIFANALGFWRYAQRLGA